MANYGQTLKYGLRYLLGSSSARDIDEGFRFLAEDVEATFAARSQGTFALRPASTPAQPGVAGRRYLATDHGVEYLDTGTGWIAVTEFIGHVSFWAGEGDPPGGTHLEANGRVISRAAYPLYMSLIGTRHGSGDGFSTVNIPDLTGRVAVGRDPGGNVIPNSPRTVGQGNGAEQHTLGVSQMPTHSHVSEASGQSGFLSASGDPASLGMGGPDPAHPSQFDVAPIGAQGGGQPHSSMQPGRVLTPIVRVA